MTSVESSGLVGLGGVLLASSTALYALAWLRYRRARLEHRQAERKLSEALNHYRETREALSRWTGEGSSRYNGDTTSNNKKEEET